MARLTYHLPEGDKLQLEPKGDWMHLELVFPNEAPGPMAFMSKEGGGVQAYRVISAGTIAQKSGVEAGMVVLLPHKAIFVGKWRAEKGYLARAVDIAFKLNGE